MLKGCKLYALLVASCLQPVSVQLLYQLLWQVLQHVQGQHRANQSTCTKDSQQVKVSSSVLEAASLS